MARAETAVTLLHSFRTQMMRTETQEVAVEVRKRERVPEECCEYTQQGLAPDELYRISEMEETEK